MITASVPSFSQLDWTQSPPASANAGETLGEQILASIEGANSAAASPGLDQTPVSLSSLTQANAATATAPNYIAQGLLDQIQVGAREDPLLQPDNSTAWTPSSIPSSLLDALLAGQSASQSVPTATTNANPTGNSSNADVNSQLLAALQTDPQLAALLAGNDATQRLLSLLA
jgi:hypothetical protein